MSRKPNPNARPYKLTPEAQAQRQQAAKDRWDAIQDRAARLANLANAHASPDIGRPRKIVVVRKPRHAVRDEATGKFVRSK